MGQELEKLRDVARILALEKALRDVLFAGNVLYGAVLMQKAPGDWIVDQWENAGCRAAALVFGPWAPEIKDVE